MGVSPEHRDSSDDETTRTQPLAGPNDEERGHALLAIDAFLARSSSSVSCTLGVVVRMTQGALIGHLIGWSLVATALWCIGRTIIQIHRELGLLSTRGFLWFLAV